MSVVTNLVVALMIVSTSNEPVYAVEVNPKLQYVLSHVEVDFSKVEKMTRTRVSTNFVFSTDIRPIPKKLFGSDESGWYKYPVYTPDELFGKPLQQIFFQM